MANAESRAVSNANLKPFKKGQSGNPKGMKRGTRHMTTLLKEAIVKVAEGEAEPHDVQIVKRALEDAKKGDFQKMKLIWNYLDGMPPQDIDLTSAGEKLQGINVNFVSDSDN